MKILITLALISITGAFAQDFGNCKACEFGVKVFFGHLRSQRGVNFQIATLSRDVCPHQDHPFICDWEVGRNWAGNSKGPIVYFIESRSPSRHSRCLNGTFP